MAQGLSDPPTLRSADGTPLVLENGKALTKDTTIHELLVLIAVELRDIRKLLLEAR